jgi:hypothetical protein
MRVVATALTFFCGTVVVLGGQPAADTVESVLGRHLAARGGLERIRAVQTMKVVRTVATLGATLNIVIHKKRGGFYRSEQTAPGRPPVLRGLDAEGLWELVGGKVTRRPEAMAVELRELDGDIDGPLVDHTSKGHTITYEGRGREAGIEVHRLKVTLKSGATREVLLDAATMLERKHIGQVTLPPDRKVAVTVLFHDYRDVSGLKFPFAIDEDRDAMGQTFAFYVERIDLDVPVDDAMFRVPPSTGK